MKLQSPRNAKATVLLALLAVFLLGSGLPETSTQPVPTGCASPLPFLTNGTSDLPPSDFVVTVNGNLQWLVNGAVNPTLTLMRGQTYTFDLTAFGDEHPFLINNQANNQFGTIYLPQAFETIVSFTPTVAMPNTIYYHCSVHSGMSGTITLVNPPCPGDLNNDLLVNSTDFGLFVGAFGTGCSGCKADINNDGLVNSTDFGLFVGAFGSNCGN